MSVYPNGKSDRVRHERDARKILNGAHLMRRIFGLSVLLMVMWAGGCINLKLGGGGGNNNVIDLSIGMTATGSSFVTGQNATYTITVTNSGTTATTGMITVTDTLPAGLVFSSATGTGWSCSVAAQVVTCTNSGPISNGASAAVILLTVNVTSGATASLSNTAAVATTGDNNATNNSVTSTVSVISTVANKCGAVLGNESILLGHYAILLHGFQGSGNGTPVAIAGSFEADGSGNITGGEEDINNTSDVTHVTVAGGTASLYRLGPDFRGCMQLTNSLGATVVFHFSVEFQGPGVTGLTASKGRIIEYDDATGTGTGVLARAAGVMQFQDTNSFTITQLQARYAFGLEGIDSSMGHIGTAGSFTVGGQANSTTVGLASGLLDSDDAGTLQTSAPINTGSINIPAASANGRGTLTYTYSVGTTQIQKNAAIYMVNANEFYIIDVDPFSSAQSITSGRAVATASAFTAATFSGTFIIHMTGSTLTGNAGSQVENGNVTLGMLTMTAATTGNLNVGTLLGTLFKYSSGNASGITTQTLSGGTYTVDSNTGRMTATFGPGTTNPPVFYLATDSALSDHIAAFIVGTDTSAGLGMAENQPSTTYGINSVKGINSFFGNEDPSDNTVTNDIGALTVNVNGTTSSTADQSGPTGLTPPGTVTGTILINADGTGRVGANTQGITNGIKFFYISGTGPAVIIVVEKQP